MEKHRTPTQQTKAKLCLSVEDMAERLGICRVNAYELARAKDFPAITVGRRILIPIAGLEAWLDEQSGGYVAKQQVV